jgi:hypothetical protein
MQGCLTHVIAAGTVVPEAGVWRTLHVQIHSTMSALLQVNTVSSSCGCPSNITA